MGTRKIENRSASVGVKKREKKDSRGKKRAAKQNESEKQSLKTRETLGKRTEGGGSSKRPGKKPKKLKPGAWNKGATEVVDHGKRTKSANRRETQKGKYHKGGKATSKPKRRLTEGQGKGGQEKGPTSRNEKITKGSE